MSGLFNSSHYTYVQTFEDPTPTFGTTVMSRSNWAFEHSYLPYYLTLMFFICFNRFFTKFGAYRMKALFYVMFFWIVLYEIALEYGLNQF